MENLEIYEKVREVPQEAQKQILGGRLKGKTDINPMWRIKKLTELFGVCGIGWTTKILNKWTESGANDEIAAFVEIELKVKIDGQWSEGIIGIGGSALVAKEKNALYTNDECYKMAYTDAISVACKALGVGADVYWNSDKTKYTNDQNEKKEELDEALVKEFCELGGTLEIAATHFKTDIESLTNEQIQNLVDRKKASLKKATNNA